MSDINDITDEEIYRAAFNKSEDECDRLRAENARLKEERDGFKHEAEMWDENMGPLTDYEGDEAPWKTIVREFDALKADLQRHKSALEKARELIRECHLVIDCFSESHDISAKNMIDNAVEHCDEFNAAINEVLK